MLQPSCREAVGTPHRLHWGAPLDALGPHFWVPGDHPPYVLGVLYCHWGDPTAALGGPLSILGTLGMLGTPPFQVPWGSPS